MSSSSSSDDLSLLNEAQRRAFDMITLRVGAQQPPPNVFIDGIAGTGKSFLLKMLIAHLKKAGVEYEVAAPTGKAAIHVNGVTLHSFLGAGLAEKEPREIFRRMQRCNRLKLMCFSKLKVLIIDEISMVDPAFFGKLDEILRLARQRPQFAFGGLQLVAFGDFCQLPPVQKSQQPQDGRPAHRFVFQTRAWADLRMNIIELTVPMRHLEDARFAELLKRMRWGVEEMLPEDHDALSSCVITEAEFTRTLQTTDPSDMAPILYSYNADVERTNEQQLKNVVRNTKERLSLRRAKEMEMTGVGAGVGAEVGAGVGAGVGAEVGADTRPEPEPEPETEVEAGTDTRPEPEPEPKTRPEPDQESAQSARSSLSSTSSGSDVFSEFEYSKATKSVWNLTLTEDADVREFRSFAWIEGGRRSEVRSDQALNHTTAMRRDAPAPEFVPLAFGARVVFTHNLMPKDGIVNGTTGKVVGFFSFDEGEGGGDVEAVRFFGSGARGRYPPESSLPLEEQIITYTSCGDDDQLKMCVCNYIPGVEHPIVEYSTSISVPEEGGQAAAAQERTVTRRVLVPCVSWKRVIPLPTYTSSENTRRGDDDEMPTRDPSETRVAVANLPLALGWAISIHKSQGMTLPEAYIKLSGVFECGQAYVAVSRLKSLRGMKIVGKYNPNVFRVDPAVREWVESGKKARAPQSSMHLLLTRKRERPEDTHARVHT